MGKRAKKQAAPTRKKQTLAKRFKCPFCANGAYYNFVSWIMCIANLEVCFPH